MVEPLRHRQTKGAANRYAPPKAAAPHSYSTDPRHSIARDQRPLRVRPKRAGLFPVCRWDAQHDGDEHVASQARRPITVHGFRSSFRDWAAETGVEFSVAEQCLAHAIGSNVTRSYLRTSMLELRRPVLAPWASFVCGETGDNVVECAGRDPGE
jgi:integrase